MSDVRSKKTGTRFRAEYQFGCYWFPVKTRGKVVTFPSAKAAREAAKAARPSRVGSAKS